MNNELRGPIQLFTDDHTTVYLSLILCLLCFFVYLTSTHPPDPKRERAIIHSTAAHFGVIPTLTGTQDPLLVAPSKQPVTNQIDPNIARSLVTAATAVNLEVNTYNGELSVTGKEGMFFPEGSAELRTEILPFLEFLASTLRNNRLSTYIYNQSSGTTKLSAGFPTLWSISVARAGSLAKVFADHSVPKDRYGVWGRVNDPTSPPESSKVIVPESATAPVNSAAKEKAEITIRVTPYTADPLTYIATNTITDPTYRTGTKGGETW